MMKQTLRQVILAVPVLICSSTADAAPFTITLDTSSLSGTQTVLFGLTTFDSSSNTVVLSDFVFGGGSAVAGSADCTFGGSFSGLGCSGDLTSGVTLEDVDPPATFFLQQFEPGATLSFELDASNSFTGPVPDQFAFFVCDAALSICYSDDASGALLLLDLAGAPRSPGSFVLFAASQEGLPAPLVTPAAPEPGMLLLFATAAAAVARRRQRVRSL